MSIHVNRTVSDIYPVDDDGGGSESETDDRLKNVMELRRQIELAESERQRIAAWGFDD